MRLTPLALLSLLAAAALGAPSASAKDDLVIGIAEFPSSLHPSIDPLLIKSYVLGFTIRTVTTYDGDGKLICLLCTEVPTLQNGLAKLEDRPDGSHGMAVTIKLKPDLQWGDGAPVTASDLAFTWRVSRDPAAGFSNSNPWTRTDRVDVVDARTAVLHLPKVLVSFAQWDQIIPEHIEGRPYEEGKAAGDYIKSTLFNRAPTTPGLWNGPYLISGYDSGAQIVLAPNPHWTGTGPGFKHIVLRYIGDTAALQANLLSGDIDIDNNITLDQELALRKQYPDRFEYLFFPSLTYLHIDAAHDNPILKDVRIRRALLMAIDRRTLDKRLFDDRQIMAASFVSPRNPGFDPELKPVEFDPAGARNLIAQAGWAPGPDGICRNAAGDRLSLDFLSASGFRINELEMTVLQSEWKAVCVEVNLRFEPSRTLFGQTTKHRAFPGLVMYTWTSLVGESPARTLGSDSIPTEANNWGGSNFTAFSDPEFDRQIVISETELDPVRQHAAWVTMQRIYAEQLPALPLFTTSIPAIIPKWLKGFGASGTGQPFTQQAEQWRPE
jgi:peptide/nickel transport system substrate-binding protein